MGRMKRKRRNPTGARRNRCSYMNDTKWQAVLEVLSTRSIPCRIKLLWHDYYEGSFPGAAVISGWTYGPPLLLEPHRVFSPSPSYWETNEPFQSRDIDWLALHKDELAGIRTDLPGHLEIVEYGEQAVILGYSAE